MSVCVMCGNLCETVLLWCAAFSCVSVWVTRHRLLPKDVPQDRLKLLLLSHDRYYLTTLDFLMRVYTAAKAVF